MRVLAAMSGGVDSAIICAIAARLQPDMTALTVGFDDKRFDALFAGEKITFRLFAWKAKEVGLP